ncbi:MAG: T9SS type A sorting domain-containing protein [Candidatus Aenigmatarchaeota archaeon]
MKRLTAFTALVVFCLFTAITATSMAAPGDVITNVTVPVPSSSGVGIGVAVGCDGVIFYTNSFDPTLYSIDKFGTDLGFVSIFKPDGTPVSIGAIAWDNTRNMIWGGSDNECPANVYLIDPTTGVATFQFSVVTPGFCFIDGIGFDATDNSVWVSDDVSTGIDHFDAGSGAYLGTLYPTDAAGNTLDRISGVIVGTGNTLYIGRDGLGNIVRIDKTTGVYLSDFATIGGRDEDLECDVINFAPLTVVWSKDAYDNTITAIEVEDGTCACGGGEEECFAAIEGTLSADCSVLGITIDVFDATGVLVESAVTDEAGYYDFENLPGEASYMVSFVGPLGYTAFPSEQSVDLDCEGTAQIDFELGCPSDAGEQRTIGFWKHNVGVATGGNGRAQIDASTLCSYLDLIAGHFNSNAVNEVVVYDPPVSDLCEDKLEVAKTLLNLKGSVDMIDRARQQLMALLLNVASGKLAQTAVISDDGATVSQAVTYCDNLIDDPFGDHELAKTIADEINNSRTVPAGWIPLGTLNIAYKTTGAVPTSFSLNQNYPNPFNAGTVISYQLTQGGDVKLEVFDILGRNVATLVNGSQPEGTHQVSWDGTDRYGKAVASGMYFYRLQTASLTESKKMTLLK